MADNGSSYSKCIDDGTACDFSGDDLKDISEASNLSDNDSEWMESNDGSADMCSGDFESEIDALDVLENESNSSESFDGDDMIVDENSKATVSNCHFVRANNTKLKVSRWSPRALALCHAH